MSPTTPVRVVVVDDHEAVLAGLERVLSRAAGVELVAALPDDGRLLSLVAARPVEVVVLDYDLERGDGLRVCLRLKQRPDPPAVAVYSGYAGTGIALAAAAAGADALVSKADPVGRLLDVIRQLAAGRCLLPSPSAEMRELACSRLRREDVAVMAMLFERVRVADIAIALGLDEREAHCRARRVVGVLQAARTAMAGSERPQARLARS